MFRRPGKVPEIVLIKPGKTGGLEKFRVGLDMFNIHLFPKVFGINIMDIISMGSLSLGRPKWGGSTWAKGGQVGEAPRRELPGSFLPLGAALREGKP